MPAKLTFEQVKQEFDKRNYVLLENEYKNAMTKMKFKCDKGHIEETTIAKLSQGYSCSQCSHRKKLTFEFVKEELSRYGYVLISGNYVNSRSELELMCPNGHRFKTQFKTFNLGVRCRECRIDENRLSLEFIKEEFAKAGYILLTKEYISNKKQLEYVCKNGHINKTTYSNFQRGNRCPDCSHHKKLTYEFVKEEFAKRGYELLDTVYVSAVTPMQYRCDQGHVYKMSYANFHNGMRCGVCGKKAGGLKRRGPNHCFWNPDREVVKLRLQIRQRCGHLIHGVLRRIDQTKTSKSEELLGYTRKQLQDHLIADPKWNNGDCHIDHVFPVKAFVDHNIFDMKIINHLTNLRCLSEKENLQKLADYDEQAFLSWLGSIIQPKSRG